MTLATLTLSIMRLCQPPDGNTSPKYKLLHFFINNDFFYQETNELAFNRDTCCHLVICLRLIASHCKVLLCGVSFKLRLFTLSVANKSFMLSLDVLNVGMRCVVMLSVVAPSLFCKVEIVHFKYGQYLTKVNDVLEV
jgi:hypothetical protein